MSGKGGKAKKAPQPKREKKVRDGSRKETGLAITAKKEVDFPKWYGEVIVSTGLIEYYAVSGCYILRPWSYRIWEAIQGFLDHEFKELGVEPSYFPMFVKRSALEAEEDHVEGFAAEVAWVTKSGSSDLAEPIAIRPTSETIMYPAFSKWIDSHRDLPLRLNQWTNVVRWEFKNPTPFLRTREFLWQEGHTAFATREEADREVLDILDLYARVYEELLAVPVIKGRKSEKEKFAGGVYTTTVEALIPASGRAIQAATSHSLGQNFAKIFGIEFADSEAKIQHVWQNSWGLTTRSIGVAVMVHGDNIGLVLPPRVAPIQAVIIWIYKSKDPKAVRENVVATSGRVRDALKAAGVRVKLDDDDNHPSGWKYNHWEQKGVPVRVEVGPRDLEKGVVTLARRDVEGDGKRTTCKIEDVAAVVPALLQEIQESLLAKARAERDEHVKVITEWEEFVPALNGKNLCLAPWCEEIVCEEQVKKRSKVDSEAKTDAAAGAGGAGAGEDGAEDGEESRSLTGAAKSLCIPMMQSPMPKGMRCFCCGKAAVSWTLFGRSY